MKTIKAISFVTLSLCYLVTLSNAQTIYEVTPGTKGNEIVLDIENISGNTDAQELEIKPEKYPNTIKFKYTYATIDLIEKSNSKEIGFEFDILRDAVCGKKDTLVFSISDNTGTSWQKEFIFEYAKPNIYSLGQNYPNPFNPTTKIEYQLPEEKRVTIKIYDVIGQEVETLVDEIKPAGFYTDKFDASGYSSGMYIYRMVASDANNNSGKSFSSVKKMMLVK